MSVNFAANISHVSIILTLRVVNESELLETSASTKVVISKSSKKIIDIWVQWITVAGCTKTE